MTSLKNFFSKQSALIALILIAIIAAISYPVFRTWTNIYNLLRQNSMIGLIAVAMTMVVLTGGIDLSVGAICSMISVISAYLSFTENPLIILILPLLIGTLFGFLNGFVISKMRVAPIISSLGFQLIARGISLVMTSGETMRISGTPKKWLPKIAKIAVGPLPLIFLIFLVFALVFIYILKFRKFGRQIYAVGGNEDAAQMMGIRVDRIKIAVYAISGFASALAGLILVSRAGTGQPVACNGWEMDAIASVAIGGTSLAGGSGKIETTIYGVFILAIIGNMINLQGNINSWWQQIITGLLLIIVLMLQVIPSWRKSRAR
ncbi:MAG: ABC transporter permease [Christensenellales bacterium]|jgi:ribose/xylose/arabinose/galactoside ABC-type transport system permease subunit